MMLQTIYMIHIRDLNTIAISSILLSFISIITTIISMSSTKKILDSSGYAIVEFEIKGPSIMKKISQCRNRISRIQKQLSICLGLPNQRLIEIMRPEIIPNGLRVRAIIQVNRVSNTDYQQLLNEAYHNGQFRQILHSSWSLGNDFCISGIDFTVKESKNTMNIQMNTNVQHTKPQQNEGNSLRCLK